jgi:catechol 2,3-dioxygenase-like lactoylglutathione lyase family enzyme
MRWPNVRNPEKVTPTRQTRWRQLQENAMNFVSTRIITADIKRLVRFYERITGTPLTMFTEDFAELNTPSATLAIGSTRTLELFGGDVGRAADSHTAIIEFLVDDVDAEYRKLADVIKNALVQEPTTMALGQPLSPVSRPGWEPRKLLHAGHPQEVQEVNVTCTRP